MTKLINHVIFALDASSSMSYHAGRVDQVFTTLTQSMRSQDSESQETRVSVYTFADTVQRLIHDQPIKDVRNVELRAYGYTALIDAAVTAINDGVMIQAKNAGKKDEDHAFLLYVVTDGEENRSRNTREQLSKLIAELNDYWTVAILVPNQTGVHYAKNFGFPAGNIEVWNVSSREGFEEVGRRLCETYTNYSSTRAMGFTATQNLFKTDLSAVKVSDMKSLPQIQGKIYLAESDQAIKPFVEAVTRKAYIAGTAYYELTKRETLQPYKQIVIVNKKTGDKYGGDGARRLLGLPSYEVKVTPGDHGDWRIFVQSTSVNRKVAADTCVFVVKS